MKEDRNLLELLEIYINLTEKQDAVIRELGGIVKKQATEIRHLRNYEDSVNDNENQAEQILQSYNDEIKG